MSGERARLLADGRRLHLQHGPIDLICEAFGAPRERARAYRQARAAFSGLLEGLVGELSLLRAPLGARRPRPRGAVARRMVRAVWPHRAAFVTPMAAVAGAVADQVLAAMVRGRVLERAYVNDGGDIALHLAPGARFTVGLVACPERPAIDARVAIEAHCPVRGVATSGRGGRSLSLGIADAVTVLGRDAAAADAAATLIANAVDIEHPAVRRAPARSLDPDSDLGERLVTVAVGPLPAAVIERALEGGLARAAKMRAAGLIEGAALALAGQLRVLGEPVLRGVLPGPQRSRAGDPRAA